MNKDYLLMLGVNDSPEDIARKANFNFQKLSTSMLNKNTDLSTPEGTANAIISIEEDIARISQKIADIQQNMKAIKSNTILPTNVTLDGGGITEQLIELRYNESTGIGNMTYIGHVVSDNGSVVIPADTVLFDSLPSYASKFMEIPARIDGGNTHPRNDTLWIETGADRKLKVCNEAEITTLAIECWLYAEHTFM